MANVRQIALCLRDYAEADREGKLPPPLEDSNQALRIVLERCHDLREIQFRNPEDRVFCLPTQPVENKLLAPGENHWAYVAGLTTLAPDKTPVLANGFTAPGNRYDNRHVSSDN